MKRRGIIRATMVMFILALALAGCKSGGAHTKTTPTNTAPLLPTATLNPDFAKTPTATVASGAPAPNLTFQPSLCHPVGVPLQSLSSATTLFVGMNNGDVEALNPANGSVRWHYSTAINNIPQIVTTPTAVYAVVGNTSSPANPAIFALDANSGALLWRYNADDTTSDTGAPAISITDSTIYIGSFDGAVHAISTADKSQYWSAGTQAAVVTTPVAAGNGVYAGANDGAVYAFSATDGAPLWRTQLPLVGTTSVASDGNVVYAADGPFLYALDASSGAPCWRSPAPNLRAYGTPMLVGNLLYEGFVGATSPSGGVFALDPRNGAPVWTHTTASIPRLNALACSANDLYASGMQQLVSLKLSDGSSGWTYPATATGSAVFVGVKLAGSVVYAAHSDGVIYALDSSKGSVKWQVTLPGPATPGSLALN